ncbi:MAG: ATP-dependent DNA helicase [Candidatus Omnitrophica bacterium]|nr:ATP-dependent DNA helicase [Candidatus Omnitrophota bacterium]
MALSVENAILRRENLIVEAGTGIGKSLAYLVPFVSWAVAEDKRIVISTYTKALQTQLYVKELPFVERALGLSFSYALCMGSENYVCLRKARRIDVKSRFGGKRAREQASRMLEWLMHTASGLRTDLELEPDRSVWAAFSREHETCLGRKCPSVEECFYFKAKREQARAHVLVVNHALLFTHLTSEPGILPEFHGLVLDEAHTLEDAATSHFGKTFSESAVEHNMSAIEVLISDIRSSVTAGESAREAAEYVRTLTKEYYSAVSGIFGMVSERLGKGERTEDISGWGPDIPDITAEASALSMALHDLVKSLGDSVEREEARSLVHWFDGTAAAMGSILYNEKQPEYVYWVEQRETRKGFSPAFHAAPVDISRELRKSLFDIISPVVLTSATLASPSASGAVPDLSFIKKRLGLDDAKGLVLDSPFDYGNNALLYIPRDIPDPNTDTAEYRKRVSNEIAGFYDILGGRMFALFTSYEALNSAAAELSATRPDIEVLKQGDLPRYVLLDVFKKSGTSVLLGTSTFWQGVDVPGQSLECVIITRLPFSVPTDPVNAARMRAVEYAGGNAFLDFQLPQAIIMFKQGFGRLIRSGSDRGVVAVLDPRIRTRQYGKKFIAALPKCGKAENMADVECFFEK